MDEAIGYVGDGIKQDGTEEQKDTAKTVTKNSKDDSARQHPDHLAIKKKNAVFQDLIAGKAEVFQARAAHDDEQNQIIDIHEIAERADDDSGLEDFAQC
jgi:hypothetical protein